MKIQAELSFYPLCTQEISLYVKTFCDELEKRGLTLNISTISTIIAGESTDIMNAVSEVIEKVGKDKKFVLSCKISNSCSEI